MDGVDNLKPEKIPLDPKEHHEVYRNDNIVFHDGTTESPKESKPNGTKSVTALNKSDLVAKESN